MSDRERAQALMMAALDGEISTEDQRELDRQLAGDEALRKEWREMTDVKQTMSAVGYREPPPEVWGEYWTSVYNRVERGVGWVLVSVAAVILGGYGLWQALTELLADSSVPGFVRIAIFGGGLGGLILFLSVLREKLFTRKSDPYKEVVR